MLPVIHDNQVRELRRLIAGTSHKPIEEIKLIFRGNVLSDNANGDDLSVQFQNGGLSMVSNCYLLELVVYGASFSVLSYTRSYFVWFWIIQINIVHYLLGNVDKNYFFSLNNTNHSKMTCFKICFPQHSNHNKIQYVVITHVVHVYMSLRYVPTTCCDQ